MKKFIFSAILFLLATTIWFSCKKETTLVPSTDTPTDFATMKANTEVLKGITVKDGILHFSEGEQSFSEYEALLALTDSEFYEWSKANNFVSLNEKIAEANTELDAAITEAEFQSTLSKFGNIIQVVDKEVLPIIEAGLYRRICNKEGVYTVGKSVCKVVKDLIIEARDGDWSKLTNANQFSKTNAANNLFVIQMYGDENGVTLERDGNCGFSQTVYCITGGNRRVNLDVRLVNTSCGCAGIRRSVQVHVWGEKTNIWGNFKSYSTVLDFNNVGYEVRDLFGNIQSFDGWSGNTTGTDLYAFKYVDPMPCYSGCQTSNQFIKVKGTGDSQGVAAGYWAWFCCGYTTGCPVAPAPCQQ
jgi:hypothetical protein